MLRRRSYLSRAQREDIREALRRRQAIENDSKRRSASKGKTRVPDGLSWSGYDRTGTDEKRSLDTKRRVKPSVDGRPRKRRLPRFLTERHRKTPAELAALGTFDVRPKQDVDTERAREPETTDEDSGLDDVEELEEVRENVDVPIFRGRLLSGSSDQSARIWDLGTGKCRDLNECHKDDILAVAWSPDCLRFATTSHDGTIRVWETETQTLTKEYSGHVDAVQSVAFSPDGARFASASWDKSVRVWWRVPKGFDTFDDYINDRRSEQQRTAAIAEREQNRRAQADAIRAFTKRISPPAALLRAARRSRPEDLRYATCEKPPHSIKQAVRLIPAWPRRSDPPTSKEGTQPATRPVDRGSNRLSCAVDRAPSISHHPDTCPDTPSVGLFATEGALARKRRAIVKYVGKTKPRAPEFSMDPRAGLPERSLPRRRAGFRGHRTKRRARASAAGTKQAQSQGKDG